MKKLVVACLISLSIGWYVNGLRLEAKIADTQAQHATEVQKATEKVLEQSAEMQRKKDEALKKSQAQSQKNAAAAASLSRDLEWMRDYNQRNRTALSTATCSSTRDYSSTLTTVFGECTSALADMAKKADGHALDSRTLKDSWPEIKDNK